MPKKVMSAIICLLLGVVSYNIDTILKTGYDAIVKGVDSIVDGLHGLTKWIPGDNKTEGNIAKDTANVGKFIENIIQGIGRIKNNLTVLFFVLFIVQINFMRDQYYRKMLLNSYGIKDITKFQYLFNMFDKPEVTGADPKKPVKRWDSYSMVLGLIYTGLIVYGFNLAEAPWWLLIILVAVFSILTFYLLPHFLFYVAYCNIEQTLLDERKNLMNIDQSLIKKIKKISFIIMITSVVGICIFFFLDFIQTLLNTDKVLILSFFDFIAKSFWNNLFNVSAWHITTPFIFCFTIFFVIRTLWQGSKTYFAVVDIPMIKSNIMTLLIKKNKNLKPVVHQGAMDDSVVVDKTMIKKSRKPHEGLQEPDTEEKAGNDAGTPVDTPANSPVLPGTDQDSTGVSSQKPDIKPETPVISPLPKKKLNPVAGLDDVATDDLFSKKEEQEKAGNSSDASYIADEEDSDDLLDDDDDNAEIV
ncbi:MAG: hypothetical protein HPY53_01140 [Brevinematales bacterium]|nr:hypothetical protein [Brevinematales bacterium]